jgi:hypothetical protein
LLVAAALLPPLGGCGRHVIPNTDVADNDGNRHIIEFCETYRRAVERRNIAFLMQVADKSYFEDGGNADPSDDLDYDGLKEYLESTFAETKAIRYEIRYRRISEGPHNLIYVDYTYTASYKIPTPRGDIWRHQVSDNRLELIPDKETFHISAGM